MNDDARYAAMPDDGSITRRERDSQFDHDRSMNRSRSDRKSSPRTRAPDRESRKPDHEQAQRRQGSIDHGVPQSHRRHERRADETEHRPRSTSRRRRHHEDDPDRGRSNRNRAEFDTSSRTERRGTNDRSSHHLSTVKSPSSAKRRRTVSPSDRSDHKKSRRDYSPRRHERRESDAKRSSHRHRSHSRDRRDHTPDRHFRDPKPRTSSRRSRSRHRDSDKRSSRHDKQGRSPRGHSRPRSKEARRRSSSRSRNLHSHDTSRPSASEYTKDRGVVSPEHRNKGTSRSRGSPRSLRAESPTRNVKERSSAADRDQEQTGHKAKGEQADMSSRGGYRGGYSEQGYNGYPHRGGYGPGHHPSGQHGYAHSSGHATPNQSYHGSPHPPSQYGGGRGGWNGQPQYSPSVQPPMGYPQHGYAPQGGPPGQYLPNHPHAAPFGAPTGPSFSQSPYRGGFRGSSRGNGYATGRGGMRGGFKNAQWIAGNPKNGQGYAGHPEDFTVESEGPAHEDPHHASDMNTQSTDNPFRPSKDLQVEDQPKSGDPPDSQMKDANDDHPDGSQSSKITFAFKAAPKPGPKVPKPEISLRFNAVAPKKEAAVVEPRSTDRRERDQWDTRDSREYRDRDTRDYRDGRGASRSERDYSRRAPTESALSRPSGESHRQRHDQPATPRVRLVKKTLKRPKPRPELPEELAESDSVFYRKPGNESVVGAGTYGKVFKGLHVYTKRSVALKRIRMEGERDGFPVTAVREIKLLQSLRHVNIVALQEVMVEKNECFMVFEYMSHDLTGLLNHPSFKLDAAQRKHLSMQMFEGLDYLHKRGVLHRDIKAANILVSNDGILKIADFGLARFYAKRHQLDYTNRVITIWYRSPELLLGETQYTPAVDIWSAACVMVEIFLRHSIFPGDGTEVNQLEKIYNILGTPHRSTWPTYVDMPWFDLLRPDVKKPSVFAEKYQERLPAAAYRLLEDMFHYDPAQRPTAAQVLQHSYFTTEVPAPRQAVELKSLSGDWHEYQSRALRRENDKKDKKERDARRAAAAAAATADESANKEKEPKDSTEADTTTTSGNAKKRTSPPGGSPAAEYKREAKRKMVDVAEVQ